MLTAGERPLLYRTTMEPVSSKVAIPRYGESVAPCFGHSLTVAIFIVVDGEVTEQIDFTLSSPREMDRLRLLRDQQVDTLICGGVQDRFEDLIRAHGIRVISWVSGRVEDLLDAFLAGELHAKSSPAPSPGFGPAPACRRPIHRMESKEEEPNPQHEEGGA